jgi:hypothetical protein
MEIKNIIGYEGLYLITDSGDNEKTVFSVKSNKFLKPSQDGYGYYFVELSKNGEKKMYKIHRLIAEYFVPNLDNKGEIDHINGNNQDNRICNLRWCTHKENMNNPVRIERNHKSQVNNEKKSKKVGQYTLEGKLIRIYPSVCECHRNGFNKGHVASCCRGEQNYHKGYIWKYV